MKLLCILLLVANALFIGWQVNQRLYGATPQSEVQEAPPLPADAPALTLLSEASEPPTSRDAAEAPASPAESANSGEEAPAAAESVAAPEGPAAPAPPPDTVAELAGPNPPKAPVEPADQTPAVVQSSDTASVSPTATGAAGERPDAAVAEVRTEAPAPPAPPSAEATPVDNASAPEPATDATPPAKPVLLCATIGPFKTRDAQRAAERRLTAQVERIDGRSQTAREARMFTVFLEPAGTEAEAQKRLDELKSKGITDYFLIRRGEMRNAIQVGTFRSQESVTKRLAELERTGYKAVVVPKSEAGAEKYWLDVVYDREKQGLRSLKSLAGEGARAIRADCPR